MPHYFLAPFFLVPFEPAETQAVPAGGTAFVPQISASGSATAQVTLLVATAVGYSPAVAGSGNVIAPLLEAGGIFVAPAHIGGLTALLYELALNDIGVYALVVVDGIAYVLPLNPEVVINLVQRN